MKRQIRARDMDKSLRFAGTVARWIVPHYSERTFRFFNSIINGLISKCRPRKIKSSTVFLDRVDGTKLKVRIFSQKKPSSEKTPGMLWIHGGGYCMGSPEQDIWTIREYILENGCTVIAPCYTLATEKPYPAALDDCYQALLWLRDNSDKLNVRPNQIFVAGSSAGGGLTAALCIYARDKKEVSIAYQMPLYPMLDDRMITVSSQNNDGPIWNTKSNINAWKLYLGDLYQTENVPVYAAPGRLEDFSDLPPAFTFVGDIEPFYNETVDYMEKMKSAGIPADYKVYHGAYHGFDVLCWFSKPSRDAHRIMLENYRRASENLFKAQPEK
jgi:acetyl esterase/lipase